MTEQVLGSAVIEVGADTTNLRRDVQTGSQRAFAGAGSTYDRAGRDASRRFGGSFIGGLRGIGSRVGLTLGAAAGIGLVKSAVDVAARYEQSLNVLEAATSATEAQMRRLDAQALKIGADTVFSANEAAAAMLELGKAGFSTRQIMEAVPEVMNLAATEGIALEQAAGSVTSALAQFQLRADQAGIAVNALAGASTASKASVTGLSQSLTLVGSSAASIGLTVQETTAALAALAEGGLEGSIAGTSLAAVFNRLVPTTEKAATTMRRLDLDFTHADGSFVSMEEIAGQLATTFADMDAESRKIKIGAIFGRDASVISAVNALINAGEKDIRNYTKASSDQAAASKIAEARMEGMGGALEALSGSWETLQLQAGKLFAPAITKGAEKVTAILNDLGPALEDARDSASDWLPVIRDVGEDFKSVLLPPLELGVDVLGSLADIVNSLPAPVKTLGLEAAALAFVFPRVAATVSSATGSISAQTTALRQWTTAAIAAETRSTALGLAALKMGGAAKQAAGIGGMLALTQGLAGASQEGSSFSSVLTGTVGGALTGLSMGGPIGALVGAVGGGGLAALTGAFSDSKREAEEQARALLEAKAAAAEEKQTVDRLTDSLDRNTGAFTANSRAIIRQTLFDAEGQTKAWVVALNEAGIANRGIIAAIQGQPAAVKAVNAALADNERTIDRNDAAVDRLKTRFDELLERQLSFDPMEGEPPEWIEKSMDRIRDRVNARHAEAEALRETNDLIRTGISIGEKSQQEFKDRQDDLARLNKALGITRDRYAEFPKQIRTKMDDIAGVPRNLDQLNDLTKGIKDLTKSDWKILLKTAGFEGTKKELRAAAAEAAKQGKASGQGFFTGWEFFLRRLPGQVSGTVTRATSQAKAQAREGGSQTGAAFGAGLKAGIDGAVSGIAAAARFAVSSAIAAAKNEQKSQSPSKKTEQLGRWFGQGLEIGIMKTERSLVDSTRSIISSMLEGLEGETRRGMLRVTREFRSQALPLAREIDRLKQRIEEANQLRASTRQGVIGAFDITGAGTGFDSIISSMTVNADRAAQWAEALKRLRRGGLNKTTLSQIIEAGPSSLAQAQALLSQEGGIAQVNALQSQINASAKAAGVTAGAAMMEGVKAQRSALAAEFRALAREFVREVRRMRLGDGDGGTVRRITADGDGNVRRTTGTARVAREVTQNVKVVQNVYGRRATPLSELEWALRYGPGIRRLAEGASDG